MKLSMKSKIIDYDNEYEVEIRTRNGLTPESIALIHEVIATISAIMEENLEYPKEPNHAQQD